MYLAAVDDLQNRFDILQRENEKLRKECEQLKKEKSNAFNLNRKITHDSYFWMDVRHKCQTDQDAVKLLIKSKKLTVYDTDPRGETILIIAARQGAYKLVQFIINQGADLNIKDDSGRMAIDYAKRAGYPNIEQLLLFAELNVAAADTVRDYSEMMHKQNGIIANILGELDLIGEQSKELFEKILMETMINIINKKLSFSDDILNLCWTIASKDGKNPLKSELWSAMKTQCNDAIQNSVKRDWYWLKKVVLPSTLWFKDVPLKFTTDTTKDAEEEKKYGDTKDEEDEEKLYLYFELLELVEIESKNQVNILDKNINALADEYRNDWDKLVQWNFKSEYPTPRQDVIPNGIASQYTYSQLTESSGVLFNSPKFYDYNQYLSQLILLAQIVDEDFHKAIQEIFNIDMVTNEGTISFDDHLEGEDAKTKDKTGDGKIKYLRGPVKLMERAKAKAQNDYADCDYPQSACVLDLNRCCLIFNDISTLLRAIKVFVNKIKYYQSEHIIGIARSKNGFIEYIEDGVQYADIKLNVIIKGKQNNIIGEVQFLLEVMKKYKDVAHNLYAIERTKETIQQSTSKVLPFLLNDTSRLFGAGINGSVNDLCKLMVLSNKSSHDLLFKDPKTHNTILHRICTKNRVKALKFLKKMFPLNQFIEMLFQSNKTDQKPIEYTVRYASIALVRILFKIQEIRDLYYNNNTNLCRLLYHLFRYNRNPHLIDYILNILKISTEKFTQLLNHKIEAPPKGKFPDPIPYDKRKLIHTTIRFNGVEVVEKLASVIDRKVFIQQALSMDNSNLNAMEKSVVWLNVKTTKYLLTEYEEIKQEYLKNDKLIYRLLIVLFAKCKDINIIDDIIKTELKISSTKFMSLFLDYKYKLDSGEILKREGRRIWEFDRYKIVNQCIVNKNLAGIKILVSKIGEKLFVDKVVLNVDDWNLNCLEKAIKYEQIDIIKYLLQNEEIDIIYSKNDSLLWRLFYILFVESNKKNVEDVVFQDICDQKTNLDIKDKLEQLICVRYNNNNNNNNKSYGRNAFKYENYSIICRTACKQNIDKLKRLRELIGDNIFCKSVFLKDEEYFNTITAMIIKGKLDMIEYILSIENIKKCCNDKDEKDEILYQILKALNENENFQEKIGKCIISKLELNKDKLNKLKEYKDDVDISKLIQLL